METENKHIAERLSTAYISKKQQWEHKYVAVLLSTAYNAATTETLPEYKHIADLLSTTHNSKQQPRKLKQIQWY